MAQFNGSSLFLTPIKIRSIILVRVVHLDFILLILVIFHCQSNERMGNNIFSFSALLRLFRLQWTTLSGDGIVRI